MATTKLILTYSVTLISFLLIDPVWLGVIAKNIYKSELKDFLAKNTNRIAALLFYSIFIIGLLYFCLIPAIKENSLKLAALNGATYGFITYATFELTNFAIIENWPIKIVPIDIIRGTILCCICSIIAFKTYSIT